MKLYNTLERKVVELKPLEDKKVKFYNCGLTVYSQPHIGNWVGYIYWDVLTRLLEKLDYDVIRVQNITDVGHLVSDDDHGEDKMEKGAREEGITAWDVADKYIKIAQHEGYELLNLKEPKLIRATDLIKEQIDFVKTLESKGYTYEIKGEGMYFNTAKLTDYGKLAKLDIKGLDAGVRVSVEGKTSITDFALWKFSPEGKTRDMEWDSPWGKGFPGWHLECSVIAMNGLGEQIDIHAGGIDHIPVHHTNEIAQTESFTNKPFSSIWIHNNHLKIDGGKMAKSQGNIYTLNDVTNKGFDISAFKLLILSKNYRTEGNFTWDILKATQNRLNNWRSQADKIWQLESSNKDISDAIISALSDDLDTPKVMSIIDEYFDELIKDKNAPSKTSLESINQLLGIELLGDDINEEQKAIISKRYQARIDKNWDEADKLRKELQHQYIAIDDTNESQIWSRIYS